MKIGIDLDETFWNFCDPLTLFYNNKFKKNFDFSQIKNYSLKEFFNLSFLELYNLFGNFLNSPFSKKIVPFDGALNSIYKLSEENEIFFITMRNFKHKKITEEHFFSYFKKRVPIHFLGGEKGKVLFSKGEFGKKIGIDLMIDDSFENLKSCSLFGIPSFLFTRSWNKNISLKDFGGSIIRVNSWREILEKIEEFQNGN